MSEPLFDFLAKSVFEYFSAQSELAGNRYSIFLERPDDLSSLENSLREMSGSYDFCYQHEGGSEIYRSFELPILKGGVIVAVKKTNVTVDFLTTLRNCVADQALEPFKGKALLVLYGTELDSITKGCKSLSASHGPLNLNVLLTGMRQQLERAGKNHTWQHLVLKRVLCLFEDRISTGSFTLADFAPVVPCLETLEISSDLMKGLNLFWDPDIQASHKREERLDENFKHFDFVERAIASDSPENRLSKLFTDKGVRELVDSGAEWSQMTYSHILSLMDKKVSEQEIEYLPGNEQKYCEGLTCWDRPKSDSTAGRRTRHIILWNSEKKQRVEIKFRFAERPSKSKTQFKNHGKTHLSESVSVVGKSLLLGLSVSHDHPTFVQLRHQKTVFHVAVVPATEQGLDELRTCYQVASKNERFDLSLENSLCLATLDEDGERHPEEEVVLSPNQSIPLDAPGTFRLYTDPDDPPDHVDVVLRRPDIKMKLRFSPESDAVTPIPGRNISQQKRQRSEDCQLRREGEGVLKVQIGSEEFGLRAQSREFYPLEEQMLQSGSLAWRLSTSGSLEPVDLKLPEDIDQAMKNLIEVFEKRGTIPSLAYFDEDLCSCVTDVCRKIQDFCRSLPEHSQITNEAENLIQIGTITDQRQNRILFTPLAPINLAYESALTKALGDETASLEILKLFGQSSLLPFLQWPKLGSEKVFAARAIPDVPQWLEYRPKTGEAHTFGSRVSQTVATKLLQFIKHFSFLFDSQSRAPLVLYLINLGDCTDVVKGIAQFYHHQIQAQQKEKGRESDFWVDDLLPIHVYIFGKTESVTQFDRLTNIAWADELDDIIGDSQNDDRYRDEIIEALLKKVHFFYKRDQELDGIVHSGAKAHIAFMQTSGGIAEHFAGAKFSYNQKNNSYSGISLGGLNSDLPSHMYGNLYRSGFGTKGLSSEYRNELIDLADVLNTIARFVGRPDPYSNEECLFQVFDKETHGLLSNAFDASQWVCFIDPQFDLDFFEGRNDVIVLHYSDQYNKASGYDAITVTGKIHQYHELLLDAILSETGVKQLFEGTDALEEMVQLFNAVNGEWLLGMVNTSLNSRKEKIGVISALKAMLAVLHSETDFLWVPISIEEIVRVSGAVGLSQKDGVFSARNMGFSGSFSDDILMIGVAPSKNGKMPQMVFFPVEVKYGTFSSKVKDKAVQQGGKVARYFQNLSDGESILNKVFRNFFAKLFLNGAEKLRTFGLSPNQAWADKYQDLRVPLLNDSFQVLEPSTAGFGQFGVVGFDKECLARTAKLEEQMIEAKPVKYASFRFTLYDCFEFCANSLNEIRDLLAKDLRVELVGVSPASKVDENEKPAKENLICTIASEADRTGDTDLADNSTVSIDNPEQQSSTVFPTFSTLSEDDRREICIGIFEKLKALKVDIDPKPIEGIQFKEGPTVYMVEAPLAASAKLRDLERAQDDLNLVLKLPGEDSVRVVRDRGIAWLEVPKSEGKRVAVTTEQIWNNFSVDGDQFLVPFAVDITGKTICIDFSSANSPHLLIAGTTGSGKSVALETIIRGASRLYRPEYLELFLIDPKGNELVDFEDLPQVVAPNGRTAEDAIQKLRACVDEMESRYDRFREAKKAYGKSAKKLAEYNRMVDTPIPRWLVVLDEYSDLIESSKENKSEIESLLKRLSQKARAAGIHLVLATQKPLAEVVNSVVKSNLPASVALKVKTNSDSRVIIDEGGAELLSGRGDALYRTGSGKVLRVQIAMHD